MDDYALELIAEVRCVFERLGSPVAQMSDEVMLKHADQGMSDVAIALDHIDGTWHARDIENVSEMLRGIADISEIIENAGR
jgi:hypothetical protein